MSIGRAKSSFAALFILVGASLLGACGNRDDTAPVFAGSISITAPSAELSVNGTLQFSARVTDDNGNVLDERPVWSVVAGGGTIDSTGLFTAGDTAGVYTNTVVATIGAVSSTSTVTVVAGALASITVTPVTTTLAIGTTQQFTAVGKDAHGNVVAITPTWDVDGGGTISESGLYTAGNNTGSFENSVSAHSCSVVGTASVTITAGALASITLTPASTTLAIGGTQQYTAVAHDAGGNVVPVAPVWSAASGGTISETGLFTAGTTAGAFTGAVTATSGSISAHADVTVSPGALASIAVSPSSPSLAIGATQQYTAVGKDANGNVVAITPSWQVVASGGSINSSTGVFTAGTVAGSFTNTVRASVGVCSSAIYGYASVTVLPGALATMTITPANPTLAIGATQQFTAQGHDSNGNIVSVTPSWSALSSSGTVNASTGMYTAGTLAGTVANAVTATSGSVSSSTSVTVSPGALASIVVTPASVTLAAGATQQYLATGTDAHGNAVAITPVWSVAAGGGTVNPEGLFTAGSTGGTFTNTVTAVSGSISGSASVIVTAAPPLASITVTPNPVSVPYGSTQQFTAVGRDAGNAIVAITPVWTADPSAGTIDADGLFTPKPGADGFFPNAITATQGTISGHASVTVSCGC